MNWVTSHSSNQVTISEKAARWFAESAKKLKTEFVYVFNQDTGDFQQVEHAEATETSVITTSAAVGNAKREIASTFETDEVIQWHKHPTEVNWEPQGKNRYWLSNEDMAAMKQRYQSNHTAQEINEIIWIYNEGTDTVEFINYVFDGVTYSVGQIKFADSNVSTTKNQWMKISLEDGKAKEFDLEE